MAQKKFTALDPGANFMAAQCIAGVEGGVSVKYTPDQTNPFRGTWSGTTTLPSTGGRFTGGVPAAGDFYRFTNEVTIDGNVYSAGSIAMSLINTPGQTLSNWAILAVQL